jgi:ABC-type multidrug transport system ATPase subunit
LLDTLFAVACADGQITDTEMRRLRRAATGLDVDPVLVTALIHKHDPRHAAGDLRFPLVGDRLVIGRATNCAISLPDPQVARRHAELVRGAEGWRVVDMGSGRPTLVDGSPCAHAPVDAEVEIRVGPYTLRVHPEEGEVRVFGERSFSALSVRKLSRSIGELPLLDDVSFTVFSGEVVAVVGPSGCGKTTLLAAIQGSVPADSGEVLLDGRDFHRILDSDRSLVGEVPQDDLVNPELTVEESLRYSGRLRFPADVTDADVDTAVERVLGELDISSIRGSRIGNSLRRGISGGQRKRVNLGQELLTRSTRVLFLDEPTSGLDPQATQDIVGMVRQLADRGRTVFLVTHDLSPEVMTQVDHLLVLDTGGRLAYFGPPQQACAWFGVATPDAIFRKLGMDSPTTWRDRYQASEIARQYVATREHLMGVAPSKTPPPAPRRRRSFWSQFSTLAARYARVKTRDRTGLFVLGVQPPLLALVMWIVFPAPTASMVFMITLSALWFGMSAAVRELISDRVMWRRERRVGVGVLPYLASKVVVLGGLVALQCVVLSLLLYGCIGMGGEYAFDPVRLAAVSVLTGWVGMALSLLVSASWTSSEAAVGTLPLLLIPQITFSSIMVSVRDMAPLAKLASWFTIQRYSFDAAIKCGESLAIRAYSGEWEAQPINGSLWKLGLKFSDAADDQGFCLAQLIGIHVAMIGVLLVATAGAIWARDRRR